MARALFSRCFLFLVILFFSFFPFAICCKSMKKDNICCTFVVCSPEFNLRYIPWSLESIHLNTVYVLSLSLLNNMSKEMQWSGFLRAFFYDSRHMRWWLKWVSEGEDQDLEEDMQFTLQEKDADELQGRFSNHKGEFSVSMLKWHCFKKAGTLCVIYSRAPD
jgi:hypothetical protein